MTSLLRTCIQFQSSHCNINKYPPILLLTFNDTHFNISYTSPTHHLCMRKITTKTFSRKMTYLHPFYHTQILRVCREFIKSQITSLSLSPTFNPVSEKHYPSRHTQLYAITHSQIYLCFTFKRVKSKPRFKNH